MKVKHRIKRRQNGLAVAEFAAALVLILPLAITAFYVGWEACQYVFINNCLSEAARSAARGCAIAYGAAAGGTVGSADSQGPNVAQPQPSAVYSNPSAVVVTGSTSTGKVNPPLSPNNAFSNIRVGNVVTSNAQFTATYVPPAPNNQDPTMAIGRVNVKVTYLGQFPSPDPLAIAARFPNFRMSQQCSYPLEF